MDKLQAANIIKDYILSFDKDKTEDDPDFVELYIHEEARKGGLIHFTSKQEPFQRTLFNYEKYLDTHIFFMNTTGGVNNLFKIMDTLKSSLTYQERTLTYLNFIRSYCKAIEHLSTKKYNMMKNERLDHIKIAIDDSTGKFVISHTSTFFAYKYPSIYVTFVFDKDLNLLNIGFDDSHVNDIMQQLSIDQKIKAFLFFIDYFVQKEFRELVNEDYKIVNKDNLGDYLLLHAMHEV